MCEQEREKMHLMINPKDFVLMVWGQKVILIYVPGGYTVLQKQLYKVTKAG